MTRNVGCPGKALKSYLITFIFLFCLFLLSSGAQAFTLNVVDGNGAPITGGFRYLVEEDNTHLAVPGVVVNNSIGLSIHNSHAPVITKGDSGTASSVNVGLPPNTRYFVSVLPHSGYANGGTVVPASMDFDFVSNTITVVVHVLPLPTAQISVITFLDQNPINNGFDEHDTRLGGCTVVISDVGGPVTQDAFGNPLGTRYQFDPATGDPIMVDGSPVVAQIGSGTITTLTQDQFNAGGAQNPYNLNVGEALIKYIPPGKYGVIVNPPGFDNSGNPMRFVQTTTIEGTPTIDAWVKANEPTMFVEGFGVGFKHVAFGFVKTTPGAQTFKGQILDVLPWNAAPPAGGTGTITGRLRYNHFSKPPMTQGFFPGDPVPECWVGLNNPLATPGAGIPAGLYATVCNADSSFTISGVPPGTYQLVTWDRPLDSLFGFNTVTVPAGGGTVALGDILIFRWFGTLKGSIFVDTNQNGIRDPGESGVLGGGLNLNLRFRDGSIYQFSPTDPLGEYEFAEVFPFFKWLVAEVDFSRLKATGMTTVVDNGGPLQPLPIYPYSIVNSPQPQPENGNLGWRTETGPVLTQAMHLFLNQTNWIDWGKVNYPAGENGGITGIVFYATTRAEDDPGLAGAELWEPGIPRVQVNLYEDFNNDGIADGPPIDVAFTDSWDDNKPTGCVQTVPIVHGLPVAECADAFHTWNQVRPGVFDGGYAFGSPAGQPTLPPGTYIVEVIPPPGYELLKEEDKNVDFGNSYKPSPLAEPPPCVGGPHLVPAELSLFPGVPSAFAGQTRPLCDRKQVVLAQGQNAAADFFLFTEVPKAARAVGFTNNDLAAEFNIFSPNFGEKLAPSWIPVSFKDWTGKEIVRVYTDEFGSYNAMLPSTYSMNVPTPSGVSPNMITLVLNDPIRADGSPDPFYNPTFSVTPWTFEYFPGKTTYLDTPLVPMTAFATAGVGVDTQPPTLSPVIRAVSTPNYPAPTGGPVICTNATLPANITITSAGLTSVLNPNYVPGVSGTLYITRNYGFGNTQGTVTLDGIPLAIVSWTDASITATVPIGATTGRLSVTRGDNGRTTEIGVTLNVVNCATTTVRNVVPNPVVGATPIQDAINAANPGDLILVAPGIYNENVVMNKPVRLQGAGAGSTSINANPIPIERLQLWHNRMNALGAREFVAFLLKDPFVASEAPSVIVVGQTEFPNGNLQNPLPGTQFLNPGFPFTVPGQAAIDGFTFFGSKAGGGIFVVSGANYLVISNNEISNNQGNLAGGIAVGTPDSGFDANNTFIVIRNNKIHRNGGTQGAGGIAMNEGAHNYLVEGNLITGNLARFFGGGFAHQGLSRDVTIAGNQVLFNENHFGALLARAGEGGGIFVGGDVAGGTGSGSITIDGNLIQGNLTGSGNGGGIIAFAINGDDVRNNPGDPNAWYQLKIFNNIIVNNVAARAGAGIFLQDVVSSKAFIINNTIANNDSTATSALAFAPGAANSTPQPSGVVTGVHSAGNVGGLLMLRDLLLAAGVNETYSNPTLRNNIIWNNRSFFNNASLNGGAGGLAPNPTLPVWDLGVVNAVTPVSLSPQNCLLTQLNPAGPDNYTGNGNLAGNPLFYSAYSNSLTSATVLDEGGNAISVRFAPTTLTGNYHIQSGSPAIGGGQAVTDPELALDYDGQNRPNSGSVDIGADEWYAGGTFFTITATAGAGGAIAPAGSVNVSSGADQRFDIIPNACYTTTTVNVDGTPLAPVPTYTFSNVTAPHTIVAGFALSALTITAQQSPGGIIIPAGATANIPCGNSVTYTIVANPGFYIVDVLADLVSIGPITNVSTTDYTFNNITRDHTITALFASTTGAFTIAASSGAGGTLTPAGVTAYNLGANAVYSITPDPNYRIVDVVVDGVSQGPVTSYTFNNIQADHTISASFVIQGSFLVTASVNTGGTIDPVGPVSVLPGENLAFSITPAAGYRIGDVIVDGVSQGPIAFYLFSNIQADHTISVTFITNIPGIIQSYYNNILNRAPEPGGAESWMAEIDRIMSLGIDIKEGFIAVGKVFFNSAEYLSMGKTDTAYVLDLYRAFLSRTPSQPEVDSWLAYLTQGVSRNEVLNFFIFSAEFNTYMAGLFGATTARPENNLVNDFYRGILSRLPDTMGFNSWLAQMRTAQCTGAQQVRDLSHQIASLFVASAEYEARGRTNSGYLEDLYDAILRRGAAPWEITYWLDILTAGTMTRAQVLQAFTDSPEFQIRVQAVIDAGCLP